MLIFYKILLISLVPGLTTILCVKENYGYSVKTLPKSSSIILKRCLRQKKWSNCDLSCVFFILKRCLRHEKKRSFDGKRWLSSDEVKMQNVYPTISKLNFINLNYAQEFNMF